MFYSLVLLVLTVVGTNTVPTLHSVQQFSPSPFPSNNDSCSTPDPTFLKEVSEKSKADFANIYNNETLNKREMIEQLKEWSKKESQTIQIALYSWLSVAAEKEAERVEGIHYSLEYVTSAVNVLLILERNQNLTRSELEKKEKYLMESIPPRIAQIVKEVMKSECRPLPKQFTHHTDMESETTSETHSINDGRQP